MSRVGFKLRLLQHRLMAQAARPSMSGKRAITGAPNQMQSVRWIAFNQNTCIASSESRNQLRNRSSKTDYRLMVHKQCARQAA